MRDRQRIRSDIALPLIAAVAVVCLAVLRVDPLVGALQRNLAAHALVGGLSTDADAFLDAAIYGVAPEYRPSPAAESGYRRALALIGGTEASFGRPLVHGVTRLALGDAAPATSVLEQAPDDRFSAFWAAIAAEQAGDRSGAEATWREQQAAPLLVARARRQLAAGQLQAAERSAALAVEACAPGGCAAPAEGWAALGVVLRQSGRPAEAEAAYLEAVALAMLPEYREGLALAALEAGDYSTARETLLGLTRDFPHIAAYGGWLTRANTALGLPAEP